jgi:hypothetical protein
VTLRFTHDYRSRAWMTRFAADAVVETENVALVNECLAAGVAELVAPAPVIVDEPATDPIPDADPIPDDDSD